MLNSESPAHAYARDSDFDQVLYHARDSDFDQVLYQGSERASKRERESMLRMNFHDGGSRRMEADTFYSQRQVAHHAHAYAHVQIRVCLCARATSCIRRQRTPMTIETNMHAKHETCLACIR